MNFLKNNKYKVVLIFIAFFALNFIAPIKVLAVNTGYCGFLPCNLAPFPAEGDSLTVVGSVLQVLLSLIFVGIISYGVYLIVLAAVKIIRSEGNEEQVQSGFKMIKGAYTGIILIFVGIIGLVVIFALFNATDIFKIKEPEDPPGINLE